MTRFRLVAVSSSVLGVLLSVCRLSAAPASPSPSLSLRLLKRLTPPPPFDHASANTYVLAGMPDDGPCIAVNWHTSYRDSTMAFYDRRLRLLGTWRQPGGEMFMNAKPCDLDGDGTPEILLCSRMDQPAVHALRWDAEAHKLRPFWSVTWKPDGTYWRGLAGGDFTADPGNEVVVGNSEGWLRLYGHTGRLLAVARLKTPHTVQNISPVDLDGDGHADMIIYTGRCPGMIHAVKWKGPARSLQTFWETNVTTAPRSGNNCYEGHVLLHVGSGGPLAIFAVTEQEAGEWQGSVVRLDRKGRLLWQHVYAPDEGRSGGCGVTDVTGDGFPELFTRAASKTPGVPPSWVLVYDHTGKRLAKLPVPHGIGSSGPYVFDVDGDGTPELLVNAYVYRIVGGRP